MKNLRAQLFEDEILIYASKLVAMGVIKKEQYDRLKEMTASSWDDIILASEIIKSLYWENGKGLLVYKHIFAEWRPTTAEKIYRKELIKTLHQIQAFGTIDVSQARTLETMINHGTNEDVTVAAVTMMNLLSTDLNHMGVKIDPSNQPGISESKPKEYAPYT